MHRLLVLLAFALPLSAAAQDTTGENPHRCAVQTATVASDPAVLQVHVTRGGKVFVGEEATAVEGLEEVVARHLVRAVGNTVHLQAEPGTARPLTAGALRAIKAGYAAAEAPLPVALLGPERRR